MALATQNDGWHSAVQYVGGLAIGALVFVGIPEGARWLNGGAFAQATPPVQPPTVNGNCNNFGNNNFNCNTLNMGPAPRTVSESQINTIRSKLDGKNLIFDIAISGGSETQRFAKQLIDAISMPGIKINDVAGYGVIIGANEGVSLYDPQNELSPLREALAAANISVSHSVSRPSGTPYPPKTPALIITSQPGLR
jgi:hypothetical protein